MVKLMIECTVCKNSERFIAYSHVSHHKQYAVLVVQDDFGDMQMVRSSIGTTSVGFVPALADKAFLLCAYCRDTGTLNIPSVPKGRLIRWWNPDIVQDDRL